MPKVKLYGGLVQAAKGKKETEVESTVLSAVIDELVNLYGADFKQKILDPKGNLANFVRIFVNDKDIRFLQNLDTKLTETDVIILMPAIGGG